MFTPDLTPTAAMPDRIRRNPKTRLAALRAAALLAAAAWADGIAGALTETGAVRLLNSSLPAAVRAPRVSVYEPNPDSPANKARRQRHASNRAALRRY